MLRSAPTLKGGVGRLFTRDLARLADTSDPTAAADELVAVGFWTQLPDGWQIEHQMDLQVVRGDHGAAQGQR